MIFVYAFSVVEDAFLKYLQVWEDSVKNREGFTQAEKRNMLLSAQMLEGLRITGEHHWLIWYC